MTKFLWALCLTSCLCMADSVQAETPSIETLLEGIPVMSSENPSMKSMRMTLHYRLHADSVPIRITIDWTQGQPCGMLIVATSDGVPVVFVSEGRKLLFDAMRRKVHIETDTDANPSLLFKVIGEDIKINFRTKAEKGEMPVDVDIPSIIGVCEEKGILQKTPDGQWVVSKVSLSGKTEMLMTFDPNPPYPIQELVVRSREKDFEVFKLSEISFNDDDLRPWPSFPAPSAFPEKLDVLVIEKEKTPKSSIRENMIKAVDILIYIWAQIALDCEELQSDESFADFDWELLRKNNQEFGPSIRYVLGFRAYLPND